MKERPQKRKGAMPAGEMAEMEQPREEMSSSSRKQDRRRQQQDASRRSRRNERAGRKR